jgi:hypothetical protein
MRKILFLDKESFTKNIEFLKKEYQYYIWETRNIMWPESPSMCFDIVNGLWDDGVRVIWGDIPYHVYDVLKTIGILVYPKNNDNTPKTETKPMKETLKILWLLKAEPTKMDFFKIYKPSPDSNIEITKDSLVFPINQNKCYSTVLNMVYRRGFTIVCGEAKELPAQAIEALRQLEIKTFMPVMKESQIVRWARII